MLLKLPRSMLFCTLVFLIEGVNGVIAGNVRDGLYKRQVFNPTPDPTSVAVPAPTPSPILVLNTVSTLTTCRIANITWFYAGPSLTLTLSVTSYATSQGPPPLSTPSSIRPTPTFTDGNAFAIPSGASAISSVFATVVDPFQSAIPWTVNVPQGWYRIQGEIDAQLIAQTDPFFVQLGSDTSCIVAGSSVPSPSPSSTPAPAPTPTSIAVSSSIPESTPSSVLLPVSSSNRISGGGIAGVVIGALVVIIIVLLLYLLLRRRNNAHNRKAGGRGTGPLSRGWGGLGSMDSAQSHQRRARSSSFKEPMSTAAAERYSRHHSVSNSLGPILSEESRRGSVPTPFPPSEEKIFGSPASHARNPFDDAEGGLALGALPPNHYRSPSTKSSVLLGQPQMQPRHLDSSSTLNTFAFTSELSGSPQDGDVFGGVGKRSSVDSSAYPPSLPTSGASSPTHPSPAHHHATSVTAVDVASSHSNSSSAGGLPQANNASYQQQQRKNVNRQSGGTQPVKKTPRKPVPAYDPSLISATSTSPDNPSTLPYTPTNTQSPSVNPMTGQGHYAKRSQTMGSSTELVHKSSFGPGGVEGKPLHYLIPDMPPPRSD